MTARELTEKIRDECFIDSQFVMIERQSKWKLDFQKCIALFEEHEATIRADERRKCADRAVKWWGPVEIVFEQECITGLRAAIEQED